MPHDSDALQKSLEMIEREGFRVDYIQLSVGPQTVLSRDAEITGEFQFSPASNSIVIMMSVTTPYQFSTTATSFIESLKERFKEDGDTFEVAPDGSFDLLVEVRDPALFEDSVCELYCAAFDEYFFTTVDSMFAAVHALKAYTRAGRRGETEPFGLHLDPTHLTDFCLSRHMTLQ